MIVRPPWRETCDTPRSWWQITTGLGDASRRRPHLEFDGAHHRVNGGDKCLARVAQPAHGGGHPAEAGRLALSYAAAGADLIDLGAQSSHYEEATLTPEEEEPAGHRH